MAEQIPSALQELNLYRRELESLRSVDCLRSENDEYKKLVDSDKPLPKGVVPTCYDDGSPTGRFIRVPELKLSADDRMELIMFKQTALLKTIKAYLTFFTALAVIGIICAIAAFLMK